MTNSVLFFIFLLAYIPRVVVEGEGGLWKIS
jgi:hypothetical protein